MIIGKIKTKIFQHRLKRKFPNSQVILNRPVDMSRLRIGQYSYGLVKLLTFNPSGTSILSIGDFVSMATIKVLLDKHHDLRSMSPFPFASLIAQRTM